MTQASEAVPSVHYRVPVILPQCAWAGWESMEPKEAFAKCQPWQGQVVVERTDEGWVSCNIALSAWEV